VILAEQKCEKVKVQKKKDRKKKRSVGIDFETNME
jgi:hypothetical protein